MKPLALVGRQPQQAPIYILSLISLVILLIALSKTNSIPEPTENWSAEVVWYLGIWIVSYFLLSFWAYQSPYLYSNGYILVIIMFHLGFFFQHSLGIPIKLDNRFGDMRGWVELAGWYTLIAMSCFSLGFSVFGMFLKRRLIDAEAYYYKRYKAKMIGHISAIGLLLACSVFFVMMLNSYGNLLNYSRHEIVGANVDSRGLGVFMMLFPGAALLFYFTAIKRNQKRLGICLLVFSTLLFLFSGYRSAAMFPALVGVITWVKYGRKIPVPIAVGMVVGVLFMVSTVGYLRTLGPYSEIDTESLKSSAEQASIETSVSSMGSGIMAVAYTLRYVPDKDPFRMGRTYVRALLGALPNIGLSMQASGGRKVLSQRIARGDKSALLEMSPSDWLAYNILRTQFKTGGGTGYSGVIEPYFNFGVIGLLCFFVTLGALFAKLDSIDIRTNPYVLVFVATLLWLVYRTSRNDISNFIKPTGFTIVILSLWWIFQGLFYGRKLTGFRVPVKKNSG